MISVKNLRLRIDSEDPVYFGQKKLKIRGRDLSNLPSGLFSLLELEVLDLSPERESCLDYKLSEVPPSIGRLINLRILMLDTNELTEIPPEICLLRSLERFALSNNLLTCLPHGFDSLDNLKSLHVSNNKFSEFPKQICNIESLEFLDFSDNQLSYLPDEIGNLLNLETLLLFFNDLEKLPDTLCKLTDIRCIWLGNNRLRQLPANFGKLRYLDWAYRYTSSTLDGNPLIHPPIEICRMGPEAIERYMTQVDGGRLTHRSPAPSPDEDVDDIRMDTADEPRSREGTGSISISLQDDTLKDEMSNSN